MIKQNPIFRAVLVMSISMAFMALMPGFVKSGWSQKQTFTSSGSFLVPAGITSITVECWGGGGGGGSVNGNNKVASGGGGGAYARSTIAVTPGATYQVVVGAGGTEEHSGGNSTFNFTTIVAAAGSGAPRNSTTPGLGGATANSTGQVLFAGGNGGAGDTNGNYSGGGGGAAGTNGPGGSASGSNGGTGTPLYGGNGAMGILTGGNGTNGFNYGGGGSGGKKNDQANRNGGSGAPGLVIVHWCSGTLVQIWTGTISTDWNDSGNWNCGIVPLLTTNAHIPDVPNKPVLSSGAIGTAKDILIESGSSLTVTGNTIQIGGVVTNNGTFTATSGVVEMKGSDAQTIGPDIFFNNTIMDLVISNPNGVALQGPLNVTGVVTALNGNLASDGHLTLLSTNTQTALVDGIGTGEITGNVTTQRYLSSGIGYKYVSSPFQSAAVSEFADDLNLGAAFATFYAYDEDHHVDSAGTIRYSSGWVKYLAGQLVPMVGYAANFGSSATPKTMDITGVLNNNISSTITLFNHNRQYTNGFNLVGNPYPSPIDWNSTSGWVKTNIENALYYFDATDEYTGTYSTYIDGIGSNGATSNVIPAMQGFFVRVADGSEGTLGIGNGARVNNLNAIYHKNASVENRTLIRISAGYDTEGAIADPAVIYFDDLATADFSGEQDALKLLNTDEKVPSLFTVSSDNKRLSINGLNFEGQNLMMIPLGINTLQPGFVNFRATDTERVPLGLHVYLYDAETGMHQDMQNSIQYRVYLQSGEHKNRFWLKLSQTDLVEKPLATHDFFAWCSGNDLRIKLLLDPDETGVLSVCNLMGQVVWRMDIGGMGYQEISKRLTSGIYIISLYRTTGIQSQKIYIPTE